MRAAGRAHSHGEARAPRATSAGRAHAGTVLAPGVLAVDKRSVHVGTARGVLELLTVQPAGKRPMDAAAWGRGLGPDPGGFE